MNTAARTAPPEASVRESAPYGRACAGCAKAKCRCILREDQQQQTCERCHRLRQLCVPSPVIRKQKVKKPRHRTAHLEEKLDSLVSLLRSQAEKTGELSPPNTNPSTSASVSLDASDVAISTLVSPTPTAYTVLPQPSRGQDLNTSPDGNICQHHQLPVINRPGPAEIEAIANTEPWPDQAQSYLDLFQTTLLPRFPFLHIPENTRAEDFRKERPLVWLAIRANCSMSIIEQQALEAKLREVLSRKVYIDLDRDLDLLLALIMYLSWCKEKLQGKPILGVIASLAMTVLFDLRLDRRYAEYPCKELLAVKGYFYPVKQPDPDTGRTNEERRAVLGCFIACANASWFMKHKPVGWTGYMEECLQFLQARGDAPGDLKLVALAKLAKLLDDLHTVSGWQQIKAYPADLHAPQAQYVQGLLRVLEQINSTTPPHVLEDGDVNLHTAMIEALIYELPLAYCPEPGQVPGCLPMDRVDSFYGCLHALKRFIDGNFPGDDVKSICYSPGVQQLFFTRALHMLYRLSIIENPSWDRLAVYRTVDMLGVVARTETVFRSIPSVVGYTSAGTDIFTRAADVMKSTSPIWRASLEKAQAIPISDAVQPADMAECCHMEEMGIDDPLTYSWLMEMFSFSQNS